MSVPYSFLTEQPYTPQSPLEAWTMARATGLSSPALREIKRERERKRCKLNVIKGTLQLNYKVKS